MRNSIILGGVCNDIVLSSSPDIWDIFSGALRPQQTIPKPSRDTGAAKIKREAKKRRNIRARSKK